MKSLKKWCVANKHYDNEDNAVGGYVDNQVISCEEDLSNDED